jgi:uncharacterized protein YggT (Ycf19 family)
MEGMPMAEDDAKVTGLRFAKVLVWLVYAYFMLAVIILVMAFFLMLFNASADAEFTRWVYRSADRVLQPFRGIFPSVEQDNGSVIDFAVLFAIIMYGIFASLVHAAVYWIDGKVVAQRRQLEADERQAQYEARQAENARLADAQPAEAQAGRTNSGVAPTPGQAPAPDPSASPPPDPIA